MSGDKMSDVSAIRNLEQSWCEAWNAHDVRLLSNLLAPNADFVTVAGDWLQGRNDFRKFHNVLHSTTFKHSTFAVTRNTVRFIGPRLALTHVLWRIAGDFDPDGTPRKPRTGIFTQVLQKSRGKWLILASQNTNHATDFTREEFIELLKKRNWD
jgi:uncharacterized protein (TIGR02246 family)